MKKYLILMFMVAADYDKEYGGELTYLYIKANDTSEATARAWELCEVYGISTDFEKYNYEKDYKKRIEKIIIMEPDGIKTIKVNDIYQKAWEEYQKKQWIEEEKELFIKAKMEYERLKGKYEN